MGAFIQELVSCELVVNGGTFIIFGLANYDKCKCQHWRTMNWISSLKAPRWNKQLGQMSVEYEDTM